MVEKKRKTLKFKGKKLFINVYKYQSNGNLAILADTEEEPYGDITVNLPGMCIDENEGYINSITKDSGLEKELLKVGIISEIICTTKYNYGKYDLASFDMEKLKEYDPEGVEKYLDMENEEDEEIEE